jgi:SAM-dependent methyltransferase
MNISNTHRFWEEFYSKYRYSEPSSFAWYCSQFISDKDSLVDLGCGLGVDTLFLSQRVSSVTGVDFASKGISEPYTHVTQDIQDYIQIPCEFDVVYARFLFHSINDSLGEDILKWTKDKLFAEFRVKGDKPVVFNDHERNFIDHNIFLKKAIDNGFSIDYCEVGRGFAVYKVEDPLVCRVRMRKL